MTNNTNNTTNNSSSKTAASASASKRILVIGGTGLVGKPIVEGLVQAGWQARVTSRRATQAQDAFAPQVELVGADAQNRAELEQALCGCQAVLICVSDLLDPYLDLRVTKLVLELAAKLDLERVGLISGASVDQTRRYFPMIDAKYQAEELLKKSGLPWVIIRPTWPMESLARFAQGKRAAVLGQQPATIHPLAGADLGRMVARAMELEEALGQTFTLHGPQAFTMKSFLEAYCAKVYPQTQVKNVPFWLLATVATLSRNKQLKAAVALMRYFEALPEFGDPREANRLLGASTITFEKWVAKRAAA